MDLLDCIRESRLQLGLNIKHYRKEQQLSQAQLAPMIGHDRSYISRIERGRCNVSFDTVLLIAYGLGIPLSRLLTGVGDLAHPDDHIPIHLSMSNTP